VNPGSITLLPKILIDDINRAVYYDNLCPTGLFRNTTLNQCYRCSEDCGVRGCSESDNPEKCYDCSDSNKFLLLKANETVGQCIPASDCKKPSLKDMSAKTCYNTTTCPFGLYLEPQNGTCYSIFLAVKIK